ncbi:hypothetical protein EV356DRAFT_160854 [Viridothelium virens]|uniref:TeaA receptor TeaR n=1 Tax=Viridothelium virens TaxID=1048519 RepID=A0A6A6H960_VIRVR|nr:hypothetical protein EV356DRAFT_160854 [Viridothelium virens]
MASTRRWEYAVPVNGENYNFGNQKNYAYEEEPRHSDNTVRKPLGAHPNGNLKSQIWRNDDSDKWNSAKDSGSHLAPRQMLGRMNSDISGTSDGDSFLDYYKGNSETRAGIASGYNSRKHSLAEQNDYEDSDNSGWIHRDKLAKIESRELEEAGLLFGQRTSGSRSNSRSTSRQGRGNDSQFGNGYGEPSPERGPLKEQLRRLPSAEEDLEEKDEQPDDTYQTSEEIAPEQPHFFHNRETPTTRPGTSRIPLAKKSPTPLPSSFIERDSPLPRSRANSLGNTLEDSIALSKIRGRSQSGASQIMLDEFGVSKKQLDENDTSSTPASPVRSSPTKAKVPNKATPTSGARKNASSRTASAPQKKAPRVGSGPNRESPSKRPVSSSGTPARPSTSHNRPEGEAPWIATMYKPDPRLPQDQQILPTHAKRMMQEQWEKEGKTGAVYDKDFGLVAPHQFPPPKTPSPEVPDEEAQDEAQLEENVEEKQDDGSGGTWPLAPAKLDTELANHRPSTSGTEHGGYKITPTVQSPLASPRAQQRPVIASPENTRQPRPPEVIRLPDPPEEKEEKKKGGCACCIVM